MMSLGITDVIISPDDATTTFFRITIVSRTMTLTRNCELVIILYFSHLHQWNTSKWQQSCRWPRKQGRTKQDSVRLHRKSTQWESKGRSREGTIMSIEFGFAPLSINFLHFSLISQLGKRNSNTRYKDFWVPSLSSPYLLRQSTNIILWSLPETHYWLSTRCQDHNPDSELSLCTTLLRSRWMHAQRLLLH